MEHITFAAIKLNNCIIFGKDHAECAKRTVEEFKFDTPIPTRPFGFLTSEFRFVDRLEAMKIAMWADQVPLDISRVNERDRVLTSEEFWSKESGGKHSYDLDKGYFIPDGTENV